MGICRAEAREERYIHKLFTVIFFIIVFSLFFQKSVVALAGPTQAYNDEFSMNEAFAQRTALVIESRDIVVNEERKSDLNEASFYSISLDVIEQEWNILDRAKVSASSDVVVITLDETLESGHVSVGVQADAIQFLIEQNPGMKFMIESPWLSYYVSTADLNIEEIALMLETSIESLSFRVEFGLMGEERKGLVEQAIAGFGGELVHSPVSFNVIAEVERVDKKGNTKLEQFVMRELPGVLLMPSGLMNHLDGNQASIVRIESLERGSELELKPVRSSQLLPVFMNRYHDTIEGYVVPHAISNYSYMVIQYSRTFEDITGLSEQEAIEFTASKLIFSGRDLQRFVPHDYLTHAELAALAVRVLGMEGRYYPLEKIRKLAAVAFDDVEESDWYAVYAGSLYFTGKIPVGLFQAYSKATMEQLNTLLFAPGQEANWNPSENESEWLTRAKAAEMIHDYYMGLGKKQ